MHRHLLRECSRSLRIPRLVLILPVIPISMGLGFGAGLLSSIWMPLGKIFAWAVWLILTYIIRIVELFSMVPFASIIIPELSWVMLVFGYVLLVAGMRFFSSKRKRLFETKVN